MICGFKGNTDPGAETRFTCTNYSPQACLNVFKKEAVGKQKGRIEIQPRVKSNIL